MNQEQGRSYTSLAAVLASACLVIGCAPDESRVKTKAGLPAMDYSNLKRYEKCLMDSDRIPEEIVTSRSFPLALPNVPSSGQAIWSRLGDSCLTATISERVYDEPDYSKLNHYAIEVGARTIRNICIEPPKDGSCVSEPEEVGSVLYYQRLTKEMVGDSFLGKKITDLVSYDESTDIVTFLINGVSYRYSVKGHVAQ